MARSTVNGMAFRVNGRLVGLAGPYQHGERNIWALVFTRRGGVPCAVDLGAEYDGKDAPESAVRVAAEYVTNHAGSMETFDLAARGWGLHNEVAVALPA